MSYVVVKWLHILSSTLLFGTGIGSAYYMLLASLARDARTAAHVVANVVRADWIFTSTTIVFQPLSGLYMVHLAGLPLGSRWIVASFVLYGIATLCWLPVVHLQIRMRDLARVAAQRGEALPPAYRRLLACWVLLGIPAFFAFVAVFYLMVAKP